MSPSLTRVACIGECMTELLELGDVRRSRTHGGDTPALMWWSRREPVSDVVDTSPVTALRLPTWQLASSAPDMSLLARLYAIQVRLSRQRPCQR